MRQTHSTQLCFDQVRIEDIQLDLYSRDTMPKILAALQKIYTTPSVFQKIMDLMKQFIDPDADPDQGRPGMTYWEILVLGVVRLSNNYTYDQLLEQANQHITLRQMLGKGGFLFQDIFYPYQTVYDNLRKFTPELLEKINEIVVKFAHSTLKIDHKPLITHTDSFVVKTNVHFPTDINLLLDAMRVSIRKSNRIAKALKIAGWQQWRCLFQRCRNLYFCVQNAKRSTSKDLEKQEARRLVIIEKYQAYINYCRQILAKVSSLLEKLSNTEIEKGTLSKFYQYGIKLIDQIERRAIKGEVIPHEEKIFSLFQEHTEWVVKGKAGVQVELGLRVGIVADQHGFILHHQVMVKQTDDKVAVNLIKDSKSKFANIQVASFVFHIKIVGKSNGLCFFY